jgi:predicted NAD/FAD-binding protein
VKKKVAVIGGGIAGLTAGYLLSKKHDVALFESTDRIGGNAYTYILPDGEAADIAVAVFGRAGYRNFYKLLSEIHVETQPCYDTYMSFHNLDTKDGLYLTPSLRRSFAQRFRHLKPKNLWNVSRFFLGLYRAHRLMKSGGLQDATVAECLDRIPEMTGDSRMLFLCALCLLSSMEVPEVLEAPASFFFRKLQVHHDVITPEALYSVRCIRGGTRQYVSVLASAFLSRIVFNSRIRTVVRNAGGVTLVMEDGQKRLFDKVVFACNPDQALKLLDSPTKKERELLGAWRYKDGKLVVHRDHRFFPPRDLTEAYTFLYTQRWEGFRTSVNGALWHQPYVSGDCEYLSTQHPNFPIKKDLVALEVTLRTPVFDKRSCSTIQDLPALNNVNHTFYCGSYFGFGLHEDAVTAAMAVAKHLEI